MIAGKPSAMTVAGVMSGTSADGVDVALVRIAPGRGGVPKLEVIGHRGFAYSRAVRTTVLRAMDAEAISVADLGRLNWRLGQVYADCVLQTCAEIKVQVPGEHPHGRVANMGRPKPERTLGLVGMHGQTLYHQAQGAVFAGAAVRATWQTGEAAVVRERCGVPVVSEFRTADLAAGGQGAPLVPMLDFCLFRSRSADRVLLNLGGIANVTVLPAGCPAEALLALDTGPANMVSDALMQRYFGKAFDRNGEVALSGRAVPGVVARLLRDRYFAAPPPKSCGREQFGAAFVVRLQKLCGTASAADQVATAAELTVMSIANACRQHAPGAQVIVAGGGVRNGYIMRRLAEELGAVTTTAEFGLEPQAKEAVAFALLAWLSWFGLAGNVAAATGAAGPRVLGKVSL